MEELFKEQSQKILIYLAVTTVEDPFVKNISLSELPSLPIDAIVSDLGFEKIKWSMIGVSTVNAKELIIEKKNKTLLEQCYTIEIDSLLYEGYKVLGKMQIKTQGDYCRIYAYPKEA